MILKANTKYRARNGDIVGPLTPNDGKLYSWRADDGSTYTNKGLIFFGDVTQHDLVEEIITTQPWQRWETKVDWNRPIEFMDEMGNTTVDSSVLLVAWRYTDAPKPVLTLEERVAALEARI